MINDCKLTNEMYKSQKKSQKEEDNWMSLTEIKEIYDDLYQRVSLMFSQKLIADYTTINNFILLGCLGGISGLSPRRSKDYTEMKIKNYTNQDNFFKAGKFYFNVYKTATDYGEQVIDVKQKAPEFYKILNKWVKINPTEYLLFSSNKQKLTSPQITRMLNKLLGENVSSSMLRHIYLTEKYGDIQNEMEQTSKDMAHSSNMQSLYIKK
jgi:integrase